MTRGIQGSTPVGIDNAVHYERWIVRIEAVKEKLAVLALGAVCLGFGGVAAASAAETPVGNGNTENVGAAGSARQEPADVSARKRKPMKPVQFMNSIMRRYVILGMDGDIQRKDILDYKKGTLNANKLTMYGKCNPKDPWTPGYKSVATDRTKWIYKDCRGGTFAPNHAPWEGDNGIVSYKAQLNSLGDRAARSVGVKSDMHGEAQRIVATKRRGVVLYKNQLNNGKKDLKKLVFRQKNKRKVVAYKSWYPADVSFTSSFGL